MFSPRLCSPKSRPWAGRALQLFQRFTAALWWVHILATLAALLVLNAIGLVIAAVFFVDFVDKHGPTSSEVPRQSAVDPAELMRQEVTKNWAGSAARS